MGNVNISDVLKAEFEKWILENKTFSNKRVTKIIDHLHKMSSLNTEVSVFGIDEMNTLKEFKRSIMKTKYFRQLPGIYRSEFGFNLDLYEEFLLQRAELTSDVLYKITDKQANVVAAVEDKIKVDYPKLKIGYQRIKKFDDNSLVFKRDSPIAVVLHNKQYQLLIDLLHQDGITTLGQLMDMNVVSYINSKNLYSWKERLIVLERLKVLLDPYRSNIENKAMVRISNMEDSEVEEPVSNIAENEGLQRVGILSRNSYKYAKPQKFVLQGKEFVVASWTDVLIDVCEELFERYPSQMETIIDQPVGKGVQPLFGRNRRKFPFAKTLNNGLYIDAQLSAYGALTGARAVCQECGIAPNEFEVFVKSKKEIVPNSPIPNKSVEQLSPNTEGKISKVYNSDQTGAGIARFIREHSLAGCSLDEIHQCTLHKKTTITSLITEDINIIEIGKDKYIHRDSIVDLDEAADKIKSILAAQFKQFDGYSSNRLLYDAVRIDLSLFLNDNDFDDIDTIYYLTKHLFSKENFGGENYIFYGNIHIWQLEPDYPKSVKGLLIHYARIAQNTVSFEECENYLKKLGLSATNLKQSMQITLEPTFLQYDEAKYLLAETLRIDEQWISSIAEGLQKLFEDNDYVISRDIRKEWYEALPSLPFGLHWTRLMLQDVIGYYPEVGYRTISALAGQTTDTIHAAIVSKDSPICTFADFVSAFFVHKKMQSQRFNAEELRLLLRQHDVIAGNELYWTMHKALDDYRFAWDNENKTVLVNVW